MKKTPEGNKGLLAHNQLSNCIIMILLQVSCTNAVVTSCVVSTATRYLQTCRHKTVWVKKKQKVFYFNV